MRSRISPFSEARARQDRAVDRIADPVPQLRVSRPELGLDLFGNRLDDEARGLATRPPTRRCGRLRRRRPPPASQSPARRKRKAIRRSDNSSKCCASTAPVCRANASQTSRDPASDAVCEATALAPAADAPPLSSATGFLAAARLRTWTELGAVTYSLQIGADDGRIGVVGEVVQKLAFVDVNGVADS